MRFLRTTSLVLGAAFALAGCGHEPISLTTLSEPSPTAPTLHPRSIVGAPGLSRSETMRAIALRSRIARNFHAPTEAISRKYTADGTVLSERVLVRGEWKTRESTLPAELATRELKSFLVTPGPRLSSAAPTVQTLISVDTVETVPVTNTDTLWSDTSLASDLSIRESTAMGYSWVGDIYYNGPGDVGQLNLSSSAVVLNESPDGDDFIESTIDPTNWISTKNDVAATTGFPGWPGSGSLRERGPLISGMGSTTVTPVGPLRAYLSQTQENPCDTFRYGMIRSGASAVLLGATAVGASAVNPAAGIWFAKSAIYSIGFFTYYTVRYKQCVKNPEGSGSGSWLRQ